MDLEGTAMAKKSTKEGKSSNIRVISQVLLKSANMSSRKEYLNNILQTSNKNIDFVAALPNKTPKKQNTKEFDSNKNMDESSDDDKIVSNTSSRSTTPERIVKKMKRNDNTLRISNTLLDDFEINNDCKPLENIDYTDLNSLNEDQEIYFLQASKDFDPNSLIDIQLPFCNSTNLKSKKGMYNWNIDLDNKPDLNLINFDRLLTLNTVGTITLRRNYEICDDADVELGIIDDIPPYPENLRKRHPLFGPKYKKKIQLSNGILEKLNNSTQHVSKKRKKKTQEIIINKKEELENVGNLEIFKLLDAHVKKEIRNKNDIEKNKKTKKEVKNKDVSVTVEIENEVNSLISQIFGNDIKAEYPATDFEESLSKHKKKSKSKKRPLEEDIENAPREEISVDSEEIKHKKKKKKKEEQVQVVNSTILPSISNITETIFDFDESAIPKVKKNKRKSRSDSFELDHFIDDLIKDVNTTDEIVKHKKHKRKNKDKLLKTV